ncbi:hypothetical protein ACFW1F_25985 [Streptomyces bungoensis]|uniref:hypothetical protein n=1 Tax=Streptomyces bungoensis TaxID=285568 RepID=UPI0036CAA9CB
MVIHNGGHLVIGYVEAFTVEEMARLIDVNTLGVQRLNRAALPHLRARARHPAVRRQRHPGHRAHYARAM